MATNALLWLIVTIAADSNTATAEALHAAVLQWREDVEFRSTFRLRAGFAHSVDDAMRHHVVDGVGPAEGRFQATGTLHKSGQRLRYSIDYGEPIKLPENQVRHLPWDQVSDGRVYILYNALRSRVGDTAHVKKQRTDNPNSILASEQMASDISPLRPVPLAHHDPFLNMPVTRVSDMKGDRLILVASQRTHTGMEKELRLTFWTRPSPPVIERVLYSTVSRDSRRSEFHGILSDFRECPGGMVARRVLYIISMPGKTDVAVQEWVSRDLGDTPPTDRDFVISIPPSTGVYGLKDPPKRGSVRKLDPSSIRLEDILDEPVNAPAGEGGEKPASAHSPISLINRPTFVTVNVIVTLVLIGLWIRRRQ